MKRPSVWLSRNIMGLHAYYALCLDEASFHRELKGLNVPRSDWPSFLSSPQANATCHQFETKGGNISFIVCITAGKGVEPIQIASLLVHEAVHIWQAYCEHIGERQPSAEFEAYSIQWLSQQLMYSFADQTKFLRQSRRAKTAAQKGEQQ